MTEEVATAGNSKLKLIIGASLAALLVAGVIGFTVYSSICPCDRTPGGFLFGDSADGPVADWVVFQRCGTLSAIKLCRYSALFDQPQLHGHTRG